MFSCNTFRGLMLSMAGLCIAFSSAHGSQVTTERIISMPDYSASSDDTPATLGPTGEGSGSSRGSVNGEITSEAPAISTDGIEMKAPQSQQPDAAALPPEVFRDIGALPAPVQNMYKAIYNAAASGRVEALRTAIEINEVPPVLGLEGGVGDPIEQIRQMAGDSEGTEILAIMTEILESGFVHVGQGTPHEMFVWPYFAYFPPNLLTSRQRVELFRLITAADYEEMDALGQYIFYRIGISPDGTWQYLIAGE